MKEKSFFIHKGFLFLILYNNRLHNVSYNISAEGIYKANISIIYLKTVNYIY